eukprot:TRINITY_DN9909_c0_g1_i2.p1 TRINITY_DN9909_c0_g1~~TRINITY_DN9909_c0_g1_i2.p1  ORF type:complete len:308 (-),score=39.22 TRINITY_DN9909_c0_g1_i2:60-983(-)
MTSPSSLTADIPLKEKELIGYDDLSHSLSVNSFALIETAGNRDCSTLLKPSPKQRRSLRSAKSPSIVYDRFLPLFPRGNESEIFKAEMNHSTERLYCPEEHNTFKYVNLLERSLVWSDKSTPNGFHPFKDGKISPDLFLDRRHKRPLLKFKATARRPADNPSPHRTEEILAFTSQSQSVASGVTKSRPFPHSPYKTLEAPEILDDFYASVLDWSAQNIVAVGLKSAVYLWSAQTKKVVKLADVTPDGDYYTSLAWDPTGQFLLLGTYMGELELWDSFAKKLVSRLEPHDGRVGCLSWNPMYLSLIHI